MTTDQSPPTERQVQRAILRHCRACFPNVLLHHIPNGAHLAGDDVARFKQMGALLGDGMRKGFPDLIAIWAGGVAFMEVKPPKGPRGGGGGKISDEQAEMIDLLESMGHRVAIVRSIDNPHLISLAVAITGILVGAR